ncbi:MAG: hypothetical protein ACI86M_002389 [Saprospiraceae bacterium]|jgi:hypothetical protein
MKYLVLVFFVILILVGCDKGRSKLPESIETDYLEGVVIIRAEKKHPVGMIKLLDIFNDDKYMESPSRAILYRYDSGVLKGQKVNQFDLQDTVAFLVKICDDMQFAIDIKLKIDSTISKMTMEDKYVVLLGMDINLHNADPHREGPQHRIWHKRPGRSRGAVGQENIGVYSFVNPQSSIDTANFYITTNSGELDYDTDYYLYLSNITPPRDATFSYLTDSVNVYDASKSHEHTH